MKYRDIRHLQELKSHFRLDQDESAYWDSLEQRGLPLRLNSYWAELCSEDPKDPLRLQAVPRKQEWNKLSYETEDPIGDSDHSPSPRLVHRYQDRVLLLVTQQCALYCRHCFRRHFTGTGSSNIKEEELEQALTYIRRNETIHEVILSGGDPLMLEPDRLNKVLQGIKSIPRSIVIRIGSRMPVTAPYRISKELLDLLGKHAPIFFMIQVNHPRELSPSADLILKDLRNRGITLLNQSVLLRGVNDSLPLLRDLSYALLERGVKPYYLFQGDLAAGTSHFRVPLTRSLELMEELRKSVSGIAMPQFAVDLPGGGKIPLTENRLIAKTEKSYIYRNMDDKPFEYPLE